MKIETSCALIVVLALMLLAGIWLFFAIPADAAEIPLSSKIVLTPRVNVSWDAPDPTDTVRVYGYEITALGSMGQLSHFVSCADSLFLSGIMDVSGIVADSTIERVRFYVQAWNNAGYSAPSDTVSLPMRKAPLLFGDLNHDGKVDVLDSALLWSRGIIGTELGMPGYNSEMDIDADGDCDVRDHVYFIYNVGSAL